MSDFTSANKIPETIYKGLPTDKLAPVDPTQINDEVKTLNNYKRSLVSGIDALSSAVPGLTSMLSSQHSDIPSMGALGRLGKSITSGSLLRDITSMGPNLRRDLESGALVDSILNLGNAKDSMEIGERVVEYLVQDREKIETLKDIVSLAQDPHLKDKLTDNVKESLVSVGLDLAGQVGLGEITQILIDELKHERQKKRAWGRAIYSHALTSDLDTILLGIENGGLVGVYALYDDPVGLILGSFRFNLDVHKTVEKNGERLLLALSKIDPHWDHYRRGGEIIYKLDKFHQASNDAMLVFDMSETLRPVARGAKAIGRKTSRNVMRETYPILAEMM